MTKITFEQQMEQRYDRLLEEVTKLNQRIGALEHAQRLTQPFGPVTQPYQPYEWPFSKCTKCGIDLNHVMGYVCHTPQCPTGLGPVMCKAET